MRKLFNNFFKKSESGRYSLYKSTDRQTFSSKVSSSYGLDLNEISLYLNRGISKRAEKVGETQFVLKDLKGNIIESHEILNLLDKPNDTQTGDQFWRLASVYKDVTGFAVIKKIGNDAVFAENRKTFSLELLNSAGVTINFTDDRKKIKSFSYTDPNGGSPEEIPFKDCIYWYTPDPKNHLLGMSLITAGLRSILTDLEMTAYQNSLLKNGGVVDSVLSFKNNLTSTQLKDIKDNYIKEYGSTNNAGVPLILGGDAEYTKIALNPQELAFLESKKILNDDITVITGVPRSILGITSGETFANAETGHKIFLRETIKPVVRDLVNVLDWRLVPDNLELDFIDPTPEDQELKLKTLETADRVNAMTINEKREVLGLDPIKGQDEILLPINKAPLEKSGVFVHPLRNKDFRGGYYNSYIKSLNSEKKRFKAQLDKYFKDQENRIIKQLNVRKQVKTKTILDEVFDIKLEVALATPLLDTMKKIAEEAGQEIMDIFAQGRDYNYNSSIDIAVTNRFNFFAEKVNETTAKELEKKVSLWLSESGTVNELVDKVKEVYVDIETWRAETIVNTEVASIMQEAKIDSYQQIGIKTKIWVWSPGIKGGVRDDHLNLDGEERPMNVPFTNGLMYPHDPSADAGEVINCECTV
jgi:HK97 family phage portal protein